MIDTVRLWCIARPTEEHLTHWHKREDTGGREGTRTEYYYNPTHAEGVPFRATYRPQALQGYDQLQIEMSLAKLVFGNNWTLLTHLEAAYAAADEAIAANPAIPDIGPTAALLLSRLDVCYNYPVGDLLPYYIQALSRLYYPRRTTARFNTETVEFRAASVKSKFYDKPAETNGQAPAGLLRHEATFHRARPIREALRFQEPVKLGDLTIPLLRGLIETDLERLGILGRPFATRNQAWERLFQTYGPNRGSYRFSALVLLQDADKDQVAGRIGITRSALNKLLADVRRAGVPLAFSEASEPLPPLEVTL
jgi:hypothetical protein